MTQRLTPDTASANSSNAASPNASNGSMPSGAPAGGTGTESKGAGTRDAFQGVAKELKGDVAQLTSGLVGEAKHVASDKLDAGKDFANEQLMSVAGALRIASKELQASDSVATKYVEKAANSVEAVSDYFLTKTLGELVNDVESYARREPAVFLGGAFFMGMIGGRFLKAATPQTSMGTQGGNMQSRPQSSSSSAKGSSQGARSPQPGSQTGPQTGKDRLQTGQQGTPQSGQQGTSMGARSATKEPANAASVTKDDEAKNRGAKSSEVS